MSDLHRTHPHIALKFLREGTAASGRPPRPAPQSQTNKGNRDGHGRSLKSAVSSIAASWESMIDARKDQEFPDLPDAVAFLLQVDPQSFDADTLKGFDIEVILELEDGYILGASADTNLTKLQTKIANFIQDERGGSKVAEIWQILEGRFEKLERILSPYLLNQWDEINDRQQYTLDISIACVGLNPKFSDYPKEQDNEAPEKYARRLATWIDKRDQTEQEWDDLQWQRETEFCKFVAQCGGQVLQGGIFDDRSSLNLLPDSFSCQIEISGKGLKDIALNYPYIFEITEPEQFAEVESQPEIIPNPLPDFQLEPPLTGAPHVCIIDSGIQEKQPLLAAAIDTANSRSWVPGETSLTADGVSNGGHGTKVAGALLYPQGISQSVNPKAVCWIQNARILNSGNRLSDKLYIPEVLAEIVDFYNHSAQGTRIFNHSITGSSPCRTTYMSAWAATIDYLSWQKDILFIVSAGNLTVSRGLGLSITRQTLEEYAQAGIPYPEYLLKKSARIANPAQSFQALTVGSIAHETYSRDFINSVASAGHASAFTCTGYGIWDSIKPDIVEYGGDLAIDSGNPPNFHTPPEICSELVQSTTGGVPPIGHDIGTSYAAPKVAHIAAILAATLPQSSCLLYRALIVQSARLPEWTDDLSVDLSAVIRMMGYGLPNLARAIGNTDNRITLITPEDKFITARKAHIYQVAIPSELRSPGEAFDIRVEITLSYKAEPRRTRRNKRKYLSNWLHWECSRKGELPDIFLERVLANYSASEESVEDDGIFSWTLGRQKNHGSRVKDASRSVGTIQKDWAIIKSFELQDAFCVAIVAHKGWNNDPTVHIPYALAVSFEVINAEVPIVYEAFVEAQTGLVETEINLQVQQQISV